MSQATDTVSCSSDTPSRSSLRHQRRVQVYSLQLTAYINVVRQVGTMAVLDSNMVVLLEALTDLLSDSKFSHFQVPDDDENDFNNHDMRMVLTCRLCEWNASSAFQLLTHLMVERYHQNISKKSNKISKRVISGYETFIREECAILEKRNFPPQTLDCILDFYFMTKSFLRITSRYLNSLQKLKYQPSTIIASGVSELLTEIDLLVSNAQCIESVPEYNSLLLSDKTWEIRYLFQNQLYNDATQITEKLRLNKPNCFQADRNIFSQPPPAHYQGSVLIMNSNVANGPNQQAFHPNIVPFRTVPPPRMMSSVVDFQRMQLPVPCMQPPMRPPIIGGHHVFQPISNAQQPRFNSGQPHQPRPSFPPIPPQQQIPHGMPNNAVNTSILPPLNSNAMDEQLKRFLNDPKLDDLIENGNLLREFHSTSVIPSELCMAMEAVAPDVKVRCYGAKVSGVGYEEDYLNLFVDSGLETKSDASIEPLIEKLCEFFTKNDDDWMIEEKHIAGYDSILTAKNYCENVCCRITFDSEIYYYNSLLIQYYMQTFPLLQKLCYYLQEFLKLVDLNFSRYLIVLLVMFYLQVQEYLPTVEQLQKNMPEQKVHKSMIVNFVARKPEELKLKDCETDVRKCATELFRFYGLNFSFDQLVICPLEGKAVHKTDFSPTNAWRMPLKRYRAYMEKAQENEIFDATAPICVQDLLQLTVNVAGTVSNDEKSRFVQVCRRAFQHYTNNQ
ncbi:uncharacterized protein LOC131437255 [Malaya genurostris]|uniref:uncharacterized protein LOC131437255 n=1 Tax=Malaya genurostris TaxID=325434 RepID=UPI0026F3AF92|nr:uncharacterized protein LOC131437255 [Malaya genurostris]